MTTADRFNFEIEYYSSLEEFRLACDACDKLTVITNDFFDLLKVKKYYNSLEALSVIRDLGDAAGVFYSAEGFWAKVKGVFVAIWNAIKKFFGSIWNGIKRLFGKGNKIPATDQMKELAESNPEIKPLLSEDASGIAGLEAIKEFLMIMGEKNKVVPKAEEVKITDVAGLQRICGTIGTQFVAFCKEQAAGVADLDPSKLQESDFKTINDKFQQMFIATASRLQPEEIKAAVVTGKTETLSEYFERHYVKKTKDPKEVINFINSSLSLSKTLQSSINQTNSGMETMQKDVMAKYAQSEGDNTGKSEAVGKVIQAGLAYARRFLGMEQGLYSFIIKYEKGLAESMPVLQNWFAPTRDLNAKIAKNEEKKAKDEAKAQQEAEQKDEE